MVREFRVVGKSVASIDAKEKITGTAKFAGDIQLPGMLYAKILGCPYPHARIKNIDVSEAKNINGIHEILTYKNCPKTRLPRTEFRPIVMLEDHLRFVGDKVAVAVAETEEIAEEALKKVKVEYEILPAVFDAVKASKPDAPKLYKEGGNIADPPYWQGKPATFEWGDVEKAFGEADVLVEHTFKTPSQFHAALEPRAVTASWNGKELVVWVSSQGMFLDRDLLVNTLDLPIDRVKVISRYVGGGFGGKFEDVLPSIVAFLSIKTNRPVKLAYNMEEECILGRRRPSQITKAKLAARKDGTFTAIDFEAYFNVGAEGSNVAGSSWFDHQVEEYRFSNGRFVAYDVNTNLPSAASHRGVHFPSWHFVIEQLIDEVAEKIEMDPIKIRTKNVYRKGEKTIPLGAVMANTIAIEECVDKAVSASGFWDKWKNWRTPVKVEGSKRVGIGVAYVKGWTDYMAYDTSATVKIRPNGICELLVGHQDVGTESSTTLTQIAAEELGVSIEKVKLISGDTSLVPRDWGAGGSRTLFSCGRAVMNASREAKQKLICAVANKMDCAKEDVDVDLENGKLCVKGMELPTSQVIEEPIVASYHNRIEEFGEILGYQGHTSWSYVRGGANFHIAEVEVDTETGEVRVLKYVAVHDVGKAINPAIVRNQIYGGVLQGLGYSLREEILWDQEGRCLNPNFTDYKIYTSEDAPDIETIIVEAANEGDPYGAKGIGEMPLNPVAGAIANAVYNAIGVRMYAIPITPERILKALGRI